MAEALQEFPEVKEYIAGIQNSLQCAICLELPKKPVITKCGHQFCEFCIMKCVDRRRSIPCPLCKEPITKRGLKHRERLDALTDAIRDLVQAYEEDSGFAYSAPNGPSLVKDITCTPTVVLKPDKPPLERVAMASLENTENADPNPEQESKKGMKPKKSNDKHKKSKPTCSFTNNDDNSLFSAENSLEDNKEEKTSVKEPDSAPDIFAEEELCPTTRKRRSRKETMQKVKNWLSRLPPVLGAEDEASSPGDDSQSSDHTVLLDADADADIELMDLSSQNATIAPDSSRSLSMSSGTSPNHRRFFKHRDSKKLEPARSSLNSTNPDDPFSFPDSGKEKKTGQKPKKNSSLNTEDDTTVSTVNSDLNSVFDQESSSNARKEAKTTTECFGPSSLEEFKSKTVRTYATTTRRIRHRGLRKAKTATNEIENVNEVQPFVELPCVEEVNEPKQKHRKNVEPVAVDSDKIQSELDNVDTFELDIITATQHEREVKQKRQVRSSKAKEEVKKILSKNQTVTDDVQEEAKEDSDAETDELVNAFDDDVPPLKRFETVLHVSQTLLKSLTNEKPANGENVESQCVEILEPVSMLMDNSEQLDEENSEALIPEKASAKRPASPVVEEAPQANTKKRKVLVADIELMERSKSPIIVASGRSQQSSPPTQAPLHVDMPDSPTTAVGPVVQVLNCRDSDSSGDELPDIGLKSTQQKTLDVKAKAEDVKSSGTKTDSITLSVSQVRYEKPAGQALTSDSPSTTSSIYAPNEPLNGEHQLQPESKSDSTKSKCLSDCSKLSESENMTMLSEIPSTQMQDNLQKELMDLSRLIREKEAQLLQLNSMKTQAESTIAQESDSESDMFESQDATCYEGGGGGDKNDDKSSPILSPFSSPAPRTQSSVMTAIPSQKDDDIIAPTPTKSPKTLAAEIARTFASIKATKEMEEDEDINLSERPTQKKDWNRIRTRHDSDSDVDMVPNSVEDKTPKRGTLDVFLKKKRLCEDLPTDEFLESSSSLLKSDKGKTSRSKKVSEFMDELKKDRQIDSKLSSLSRSMSSLVAKGGEPVLPSLSRSRTLDSPHANRDNAPSEIPVDLSESCDFLAALRAPTAQPSPTIIPDSETVEVGEQNTARSEITITKKSQNTQKSEISKLLEKERSPLPATLASSVSPRLVGQSSTNSPLVASGSASLMSPYHGELLRAKREQCRGLVVSGLDSHSREYVSAFAKKFDFAFSSTFNDETSHVVVQTIGDDELVCDRTLKYFLGIAGRCWVLSKQWLVDSVEQNFLEPEDGYEIKGDTVNGPEHEGPWRARNSRTQLLANYTVCCHGQFTNLARDDIVRLIELCGGQAVIDEKDFTKPGPNKWRRLVLAEPHEDLRSSYFGALKVKFGMPVVSREWLLDSVAKYQIQKLKDYSLCT